MEHLTKQQLVLVAMLIAFVTSISTGIVTVSLMENSTQPITQTVNRVVERTIEKVVQAPADGQKASAATIIREKETVIVKADDMVVEAVEKNKKSLVKILKKESEDKATFVANGFVLSDDGRIIVPFVLSEDEVEDSKTEETKSSYLVILPDGSSFDLRPVSVDKDNGWTFFHIVFSEDNKPTLSAVSIADENGIKLGQTVVTIGGDESLSVETGIVKILPIKEFVSKNEKDEEVKTSVLTEVVTGIGEDLPIGAPLVTLTGDVVALKVGKIFKPIHKNLLEPQIIE
ncbi:MAG: serine protease [bacterium]|nr:serine protease [bacterium]